MSRSWPRHAASGTGSGPPAGWRPAGATARSERLRRVPGRPSARGDEQTRRPVVSGDDDDIRPRPILDGEPRRPGDAARHEHDRQDRERRERHASTARHGRQYEGGTRTADGPPYDCWEVWAPDATELLAVCGPWTIIPMDGSEPRRLTIPPETATIDWQR